MGTPVTVRCQVASPLVPRPGMPEALLPLESIVSSGERAKTALLGPVAILTKVLEAQSLQKVFML